MPIIHALFGSMDDPFRIWPVTWSIDPVDIHRAKARCEAELKAHVAALTKIWEALEALTEPSQRTWIKHGTKSIANKSYDQEMKAYWNDRERLEAEEHAINKRFTESALDALFPTGNDGWCPEVEYVVMQIPEGLRDDFNAAELMLMRARLHSDGETNAIGGRLDDDGDDDD